MVLFLSVLSVLFGRIQHASQNSMHYKQISQGRIRNFNSKTAGMDCIMHRRFTATTTPIAYTHCFDVAKKVSFFSLEPAFIIFVCDM